MNCLMRQIRENILSLASNQWHAPAIRTFTLDATNSFWHLDTHETKEMFVLHDLALDAMIETAETHPARYELEIEWQAQSTGDARELKKRTEFHEGCCGTEHALPWYTRDALLYRLLNKVLRTRDFDAIYRYRCIITDLKRHLEYLKGEFLDTKPVSLMTVYRGQIMCSTDFEKLTVNGIIATNSYFSTTESVALAEMFAGIDNELPDDQVSVVYQITVDVQKLKKPFAKLDKESLSGTLDEQEVLFSVGTVFQIQRIIQTDKFYNVFLTSVDDDVELDSLFNQFKAKYQDIEPKLKLGKYLMHSNKTDSVERLYSFMLYEYQSRKEPLPKKCADMYFILGTIYKWKQQYHTAQLLFDQSISIAETYDKQVLIQDCYRMIDLMRWKMWPM